MPRVNIPQQRQSFLPDQVITPNEKTVLRIPNTGQLQNMEIVVDANFTPGVAVPADPLMGGIANLIKSISIEINGVARTTPLSGRDLTAMAFFDRGREFVDIASGDERQLIVIPWTFLLARTNDLFRTALDIRKREGRDLEAFLEIEWGDETNCFGTPAGYEFLSADVQFRTRFGVNSPDPNIRPMRDIVPYRHKILSPNDNAVFDIPRRSGTQITRIFAYGTNDGIPAKVMFDRYKVTLDGIERFENRANIMEAELGDDLSTLVPRNYDLIDLLNFGAIETAEFSDNLDEDPKLECSVRYFGGDTELNILVEYIKAFREV